MVLETENKSKPDNTDVLIQQLYAQIGELKVANDWLKKALMIPPLCQRRTMIEKGNRTISITEQCDLLSLHRSGVYYVPVPEKEENLAIMRILDEQYLETPFYGVERLFVIILCYPIFPSILS